MAPTEGLSPTIRHATREDVPSILAMIYSLAEYEHETSSVAATPEKLLSTLAFAASPSSSPADTVISPSRPARALLLFPPSSLKPVGLALYFYNYSTWRAAPGIYLEDLYVEADQRGKGYGKMLIQALAKEVVEMDGGRFEWSVLKWNQPSIDFYERMGAKMMSGWVGMRVEGEKLLTLAGVEGENKEIEASK